jgi:hypothetical protein
MGGPYAVVTRGSSMGRTEFGVALLASGATGIVAAHGGEFVLRAFSGADLKPAIVRVWWRREPMTEAVINRFRSVFVIRNGVRTTLPFDSPASDPTPSHLPPVMGLALDRNGRIWVRLRSDSENLDAEHIIFNDRGHPVGRVMLPGRLQFVDAGPGYVLGRYTNIEGVHTIRRYRIVEGVLR